MNLQTIISLIAGIGIGTIISAIINIHYQRKKLLFETKLSIYSQLIEARNNIFGGHDQERFLNFHSRLSHVELIGPDEVINLCHEFRNNSNDNRIMNELVNSMRIDLNNYDVSLWSEFTAYISKVRH